jgi:hypothetical protein
MKVRYTKWGDRPHWRFEAEDLGRDRHGLWLGGRRGITQQRGNEPPILSAHDFVMLVPETGCYTAFWDADDPIELYVDVSTRPIVDDRTVAVVDLDLDVVRYRTGEVQVLDEDEFAEHQVLFDYPPWLIEQARTTADWLVRAISDRVEPFGDVGARWLAEFQLLVDVPDNEEH